MREIQKKYGKEEKYQRGTKPDKERKKERGNKKNAFSRVTKFCTFF